MVGILEGQNLLSVGFLGGRTLDSAPSSNRIPDYWGGQLPPCPPYNYPTDPTTTLLRSLLGSKEEEGTPPPQMGVLKLPCPLRPL